MRYFLDTEFFDNGVSVLPISLALIAEDGRELYVEFRFDPAQLGNDCFIREKVLPHLRGTLFLSRDEVAQEIRSFVGDDPNPQFWAWYGAYDWVLLCQVFGSLMRLPANFPDFIRDLRQVCAEEEVPLSVLPPVPEKAHEALADARWIRDAFNDVNRWLAFREKHRN